MLERQGGKNHDQWLNAARPQRATRIKVETLGSQAERRDNHDTQWVELGLDGPVTRADDSLHGVRQSGVLIRCNEAPVAALHAGWLLPERAAAAEWCLEAKDQLKARM